MSDTEATLLETPEFLARQRDALAASMLYEYRLGGLGKEFAARDLAPVIVKGQAIVDLAFPKDEIRLSADVDLLVSDDEERVAAALEEIGYAEKARHSRHFEFGERVFLQAGKRLPDCVELHRCLDKIILRPIPYAEILARATPSGREGFRYPVLEDLILLAILHASADMLFDPERIRRDLRFLLGHSKPDMDMVWSRARQWELSRALHRLSNGQYPQEAVTHTPTMGAYFASQALWHDRPITVLRGLAKYSLARLLDRLFP